MKTWIINLWDAFRTGFWFVPTLMALASVGLAWLMPVIDRHVAGDVESWFGWAAATAPAARLSLSSIAGAMITVTGVVFSITIVALANTATQFGSRLLRAFMEDGITHVALGSLLGTSLYCLLVLRVVQDNEHRFVPHLSVAVGILGAILSMGVFIYFIHNIAQRLQAPNLVYSVAVDLNHAVQRLFPEKIGTDRDRDDTDIDAFWDRTESPCDDVHADKQGYLQAIDHDGLMQFAVDNELTVRLYVRPGAFLCPTKLLARIRPADRIDSAKETQLNTFFITGRSRTPRQDLEYAIQQVVEIAIRALSPGINDPFTAMTCVDYLGAALAQLASREIPSPLRLDNDGEVRVLAEPVAFGFAMRCALRPILHFGRDNPMLYESLLQALANIKTSVRRSHDKAALREEIEHLQIHCERHMADDAVRTKISDKCKDLAEGIQPN